VHIQIVISGLRIAFYTWKALQQFMSIIDTLRLASKVGHSIAGELANFRRWYFWM